MWSLTKYNFRIFLSHQKIPFCPFVVNYHSHLSARKPLITFCLYKFVFSRYFYINWIIKYVTFFFWLLLNACFFRSSMWEYVSILSSLNWRMGFYCMFILHLVIHSQVMNISIFAVWRYDNISNSAPVNICARLCVETHFYLPWVNSFILERNYWAIW